MLRFSSARVVSMTARVVSTMRILTPPVAVRKANPSRCDVHVARAFFGRDRTGGDSVLRENDRIRRKAAGAMRTSSCTPRPRLYRDYFVSSLSRLSLRQFGRPRLANDRHPNLPGIGHVGFDFARNVACKHGRVLVGNLVGLDDHTHLA